MYKAKRNCHIIKPIRSIKPVKLVESVKLTESVESVESVEVPPVIDTNLVEITQKKNQNKIGRKTIKHKEEVKRVE